MKTALRLTWAILAHARVITSYQSSCGIGLKVTVWARGCLDPIGKDLEWKVTDLTFPVFFVGDEGRCRGKSFPIF